MSDDSPPRIVEEAATALLTMFESEAVTEAIALIVGGTALAFDDIAGDAAYASVQDIERQATEIKANLRTIIGAMKELE